MMPFSVCLGMCAKEALEKQDFCAFAFRKLLRRYDLLGPGRIFRFSLMTVLNFSDFRVVNVKFLAVSTS